MSFKIFHGDCLETLQNCPDNYMDSIVTDPPYGLAFMGKKWDYDVPSTAIWKECLRVLKPGGHLLAFGGTRTYHRLVVNIEDAGFEIRDQIQWIYGQGFPKSQNISKAIDKAAGVAFDVIPASGVGFMTADGVGGYNVTKNQLIRKGESTPEAKQWSGWGSALKPANEPICLARKPISESTIANNVLKHGTGGLNIDGGRIGFTSETDKANTLNQAKATSKTPKDGLAKTTGIGVERVSFEIDQTVTGRFPSNVILDEDAAQVLDEQSGQEASRFYYIPKVSSKERGDSTHPTMKPIKLMEYLIKLVTPEGGVVLDPFMGSGTTGVAAIRNGFQFRGIEREESYFYISQTRLEKEDQ